MRGSDGVPESTISTKTERNPDSEGESAMYAGEIAMPSSSTLQTLTLLFSLWSRVRTGPWPTRSKKVIHANRGIE